MGRWIKGSSWHPNFRQPQLFHKTAMRYTCEPVHERYELLNDRPLGTLRNEIWQFPFRDLGEIIRKADRYSTLGAEKLARKRISLGGALGHAIWAFLRLYVFKLGFRDGWAGFVIAFGNFFTAMPRPGKRDATSVRLHRNRCGAPDTPTVLVCARVHHANRGAVSRKGAATRNTSSMPRPTLQPDSTNAGDPRIFLQVRTVILCNF